MIDDLTRLLSDFEYLTGQTFYVRLNSDHSAWLVEKHGTVRERFQTFEALVIWLRSEVR